MVFQEPMAAFDPVFTIGDQITESIVQHKLATKAQASERAVELLRRVGIPEPEPRMKQYPNELSGGMLQRAMIAMALACGPELAHCRRADDRTGCHDPGANPAAAAGASRGIPYGNPTHHP
ncbi:ATP-binding cassette domain-containing protein [Paenibacillus sp. P25]|nr:ATP-binding cassette domain-containing protein [Paenibacillus sp. P25]